MQIAEVRTLAVFPLALALIAGPAFAESEPAREPSEWAPPKSGTGEMDQTTLKTGETLYGKLDRLRDRKVYFDSDGFDDLDFKWSKVKSIRLPSLHIFRLDHGEVTGTAEMRGDRVRVRTSRGEIIEFARSEIVSITEGGEEESSYWSGEVGVALSVRDGNTDQVDVSGDVRIKRETGLTRWINDYRGGYSELEGDTNANNHRAGTKLDIYLTRRAFLTVPTVEYFRDEFQNIKMRLSPGVALGYQFVDSAVVEWDGSVGGGHQYTEFFDGPDSDNDFAAVVESKLEIDITSAIELDSRYKVQIVTTDLDKTSHHFETELSNDIWGPVELDITFIWDRIEKPVADNSGDRPKSDDYRLLVGFSADF